MTVLQPRSDDLLADTGRPLLKLIQHLTGMETSFITAIDWDSQQQDVVLSLNTGSIHVEEGGRVEWRQSLCRSMFLAGRVHSADVVQEVPDTEPARKLGMHSFFAVPIQVGEVTIGTVCGASARAVELSQAQVESMELIAASLREQLDLRIHLASALEREEAARLEVETARRQADQHHKVAQKLEVLANTDALTGLLNRRAFTARWEEELARSARRGHTVGVLLIDLDRFKAVNDSAGHAAGDAVLVALATSLRAVSTSADVAARLGGDEFAMVVTHAEAPALLDVAARVRERFAAAMHGAGTPGITVSIGVAASAPGRYRDLLAAADRALYASKARHGDCAHLAGDEGEASRTTQQGAACVR
ncbi:sensor domain-containing diguanylate cyclase [Lysobacter sp. A3-1-A15]|uniref:sensor domain-containing diguanylate cyclase n=1 Tax=Novilysobacter viscosus TaxID=3098602 RepID=UPI002EDA1594